MAPLTCTMRGLSKFNDETVNHRFKYITNLLNCMSTVNSLVSMSVFLITSQDFASLR